MFLPKKLVVLVALALGMFGLIAPAEAATARSLSLTASPSLAIVSTPVTYSGRLTNTPVGSTVRIQRKSGATWVLARTTQTTNTAGNYSVKLNAPAAAGSYTFRAFAPATATRAAATSATRTITALVKPTATLTATPTAIDFGQTSLLTGSVSPFVAGTAVTVQKLVSGTWVDVTFAQLDPNGAFSKAVSPTATTTYRVLVPRAGLIASTASPSRTVTVDAAPAGPTVTTTSLPSGSKNVAYNATLTSDGGAGSWSITAGALPSGITLTAATGALSGTPVVSGTFNFTVKFTSTATGLSGSKALSIVVSPALQITTATNLPDATRAQAYSVTLTHTGGPGTWTVQNLPPGLTVNGATGEISGLPTQIGDYGVYPTFTETGTGRTAFKALALHVGGVPLEITTASLPNGTKGVAYSVTLTKTGGAGTWSTATALPTGLSINADTGTISGTPTAPGLYSVYPVFTETATGSTAYKGFALTIDPSPVITTTTVPDGVKGTAYSQQLAKTGQAGTWSLKSGNLPPGITFSSGGLLSGTPTQSGDFGFKVQFAETSTGYVDTQSLLLHISDPGAPVINTTTLPDGTIGVAYNGALSGVGTGTWQVTFGQLPPGLVLDGSTGAITGTPVANLAEGDWLFQVTFTTASGNNTKVLNIHINPAPAPPTP